MHAIRISRIGGPEVLEFVEVETPKPKAGETLVRLEAVGVNYIDVYHRIGLYKLPLPFIPGSEAAGVVEEVGDGVASVKRGDRVAYAMVPGAYAEFAAVPETKLVAIPADIDTKTAAAAMLQGMTAHYLVDGAFKLQRGHRAIVHAAAGGVGAILVQMVKQRGAFVYGTASTHKLDIARDAGADVVIDYTTTDFAEVVMRETGGEGVNVVYDSVGKTTFDKSLDCVGLRGMLVLFGQSSGPVPPFDPARLAKRGAFLTRPSLAHYTATREELQWRSRELFEAIESKAVTLRIAKEFPLREAAEAHRVLESREAAGKLLLLPW